MDVGRSRHGNVAVPETPEFDYLTQTDLPHFVYMWENPDVN